ncbi:MAG: ribonuclease HII [Slackia sp.]|nr:ribonuclease HII [Slackia sp.]
MTQTLAEIRAVLGAANEEEWAEWSRLLEHDERKGVKQALASARRRLDAASAEEKRLAGMYDFQREMAGGSLAAGLDEVGRGPVAGPLTVAAVVLPDEPRIAGLNDSKQIKPECRDDIAAEVKRCALAWSIEHIPPAWIDEHGMAASLRTAFSRALAAVDTQLGGIDCVLLDGNALGLDPRERNVVKGDARCASIAAASVIAKVERDAMMREYAKAYPAYGFDSNKGYASAEHIAAIEKHGLSPLHRATFCRAWTQESLF